MSEPIQRRRRRTADTQNSVPYYVSEAAANAAQPSAYDPQYNDPQYNDPQNSQPQQGYPRQPAQGYGYPDNGGRPVSQNTRGGQAIPDYVTSYADNYTRTAAGENRSGRAGQTARQNTVGHNGIGYVPPSMEPESVSRSRSTKQRKINNSGKPPFWIIPIVLMVIVAVYAGVRISRNVSERRALEAYVSYYDNVFCNGVYVDGISLGGMTQEEAINAVSQQAQQRNDSWYVNLTYEGEIVTTINASMLNMTTDVYEVLREAWAQGHSGATVDDRKAEMDALQVTPWYGYTAMPSGDTSVVDTVLETISNNLYKAPVSAALISFNPENSYPFTFQEEEAGRVLDVEPLKQTIYQMVSTMQSGDIQLEPSTIEPTTTVEDLKANLTLRSDAYTSISTSSTTERTNNIRRCFQSISGYILEPGSKFSFNNVVGQRTTANGFYEAIEYAYGEHVMGVGGGSCQASTTLYQAAVCAGLEIVTREPHSDGVNYCDYGLDATVYWNSNHKIDLVFRNNTEHPIYIVAAVQSDPNNRKRFIARVMMYGEDLGDVSYGMVAETTEVLDPPSEPTYVKDKNATYVTYTDQEYVYSKAQKGYVVDSYRVTYVNGVETERVHLYTDTYKAKAETIYVGVTKR